MCSTPLISREHITKLHRVIDSCRTQEQFETAKQYLQLFRKAYPQGQPLCNHFAGHLLREQLKRRFEEVRDGQPARR